MYINKYIYIVKIHLFQIIFFECSRPLYTILA